MVMLQFNGGRMIMLAIWQFNGGRSCQRVRGGSLTGGE